MPGQPDRTEPTRETIMKSWIGLAAIAGTHAGCKYLDKKETYTKILYGVRNRSN